MSVTNGWNPYDSTYTPAAVEYYIVEDGAGRVWEVPRMGAQLSWIKDPLPPGVRPEQSEGIMIVSGLCACCRVRKQSSGYVLCDSCNAVYDAHGGADGLAPNDPDPYSTEAQWIKVLRTLIDPLPPGVDATRHTVRPAT